MITLHWFMTDMSITGSVCYLGSINNSSLVCSFAVLLFKQYAFIYIHCENGDRTGQTEVGYRFVGKSAPVIFYFIREFGVGDASGMLQLQVTFPKSFDWSLNFGCLHVYYRSDSSPCMLRRVSGSLQSRIFTLRAKTVSCYQVY